MTTSEKRKELLARGVKIRLNASDENVEEVWAAHSGEPKAAPTAAPKEEPTAAPEVAQAPVEDASSPGEPKAVPTVAPHEGRRIDNAAFRAVIAEFGGVSGDKAPEVIAWARKNLTAKAFEAHYGGRKFEG